MSTGFYCGITPYWIERLESGHIGFVEIPKIVLSAAWFFSEFAALLTLAIVACTLRDLYEFCA